MNPILPFQRFAHNIAVLKQTLEKIEISTCPIYDIKMSSDCQKTQEPKNTPKKSTSPGNVDKKAGKSDFANFPENALAISSVIG